MGVEFRYSGGVSNKFAVTSLGGAMSTEVIPDAVLQNLFDDVNRVEVINGRIEHRCFFINNNGAQDYYRTRFITIVIPTDTEVSFAVDESDIPQLLSTEDATPLGLSFLKFSDWNTLEVPIGRIDIGKKIAIWLKRKVTVGSDSVRTISFIVDGEDNVIVTTGDFGTIENQLDNEHVRTRSPSFFADIDFVGESLLS